jgi:Fe-S-cluster containining protein
MELSSRDIKRLEEAGYHQVKFTVTGIDDITRLRNIGKWCYFYNHVEKRCRVYKDRPLGCDLYPVVYSIGEGIIIDELCPMGETISEHELKTKGRILIKLLKTMNITSEYDTT